MNLSTDAIELLAAEYVIGTLHGRARERFEKLLRLRADARLATWEWEQRLLVLCRDIEPVRPPRSLWRGVRRRIGSERRETRLWPRFLLAGMTAAIAAVAFWLGGIVPGTQLPGEPEHMVVFAGEDSRPLWVLNIDADTNAMMVRTLAPEPLADDSVHQLWALPAGGDPVSLGLLGVDPGERERILASTLLPVIEQSASFAISVEPAGGSPTGLPTGPVVYQAARISL